MGRVLDEIAEFGHYTFSPDTWLEDQPEVDELLELGLIVSLADALDNDKHNGCYIYIAKGNPLNLNWVYKENRIVLASI